ncbi:Killer toxin subunits alpha/beta 6 [Colletotrichum truncatum]|uniref:Killer toxin subunits alpha/beta 6 n=1 Tax=Colletotrichum truncatum TaxID=5467 RepID=A0ACC3YDF1_COLTU|nr:Killer toxin subunits alpha/beta 6 [Colletotrichum truncatum]KAF6784855.1 Killer toxin subunits alpha/beta 6 [Colletotrichum truncatum]
MWPTTPPSRLLLLLLSSTTAITAASSSSSSQSNRVINPSNTCPRSCATAKGPEEWNLYHDTARLAVCPEPMLVAYNLLTPFGDPDTHTSIRACTLGDANTKENFLVESGYVAPDAEDSFVEARQLSNFAALSPRQIQANVTCGAGLARESRVSARLSWWNSDSDGTLLNEAASSDVAIAIEKLSEYMKQVPACEKKIAFLYLRGTLVGLYAGTLMDKSRASASLLQKLSEEIKAASPNAKTSAPVRAALEVCGNDRTAPETIGVVADMSGDFAAVQKVMLAWSQSQCFSESDAAAAVKETINSKTLDNTAIWSFDTLVPPTPAIKGRRLGQLDKRAECRSIKVEEGDDCATLAKRCGLGTTAFKSFNKLTDAMCIILSHGGSVCCSSGTLPNTKPKPNADGTCATYVVQEGEGCQAVATKHGIKVEDIDEFNKKTWGWDGCKNLQFTQKICVSEGNPAMPSAIEDAQCGPGKPGTKAPGKGEDLADLNPCPLKVCCNVWGNCGTTTDFCVVSKSSTGNPGTSKPGENGCISNCGMELVNNDTPPEQFRKIGYFEAWNFNRPCLNMHVLDIDRSYTHVHFAFGEISTDYQVVIPDDQREQWDAFVGATDFPKKILAFGGWAFSNEGPNARLLRDVVSPANRGAFSDRVVKFAVDNNLSGLDFDWEYPGATDIEGSPPGSEEDGENYYQFLKLVREKLPKGKSLSIAAPASYWYLKGFPIEKMAEVLDYIVYMTYDFHGQWDVGNEWSMPGCPAGNCLRSHVNSTTTHDALVMITKAGVKSHKIVVGVSSYGRSFKMSSSTCRGPMCTFLGKRNESPAKKGRCTDTAGYISDFEIAEIIKKGGAIKSWYDAESDSDYLVYDQVEWVAYMSKVTKSRRQRDYMKLNFGGTSDWAIDLQGEGSGKYSNGTGRPVYLDPKVYDDGQGAKCQPPCVLIFPPSALPEPTTIKPGKFTSSLEYGASGKTTISGKETTAFVTKTTTITIDIPALTVSSMSYSNVNITNGQKSTQLLLTPSIKIGPVSIKVPDGEGGTTVRTLTLPPWPAVTGGPAQSGPSKTGTSTVATPTGGGGGDDDDDDDEEADFDEMEIHPDDTEDDDDEPSYTQYPPHVVTPIPGPVNNIEPTDDGFITPCNLWFFNFCPSNIGPKGGLKWTLPPGIYPPGPPPPNIIAPPGGGGSSPGPTIKPPPPPWPPITVGGDSKPTFTEKPDCETESASLCSTTTTLKVTTIGQITSTVTSTASGCDTIYGCSLTDWETQITTRTDACELPSPTKPITLRALHGDVAKERVFNSVKAAISKRQNDDSDCDLTWWYLVPVNMDDPSLVRTVLDQYGSDVKEIKSDAGGFTAFYLARLSVRVSDEFKRLADGIGIELMKKFKFPPGQGLSKRLTDQNSDVEMPDAGFSAGINIREDAEHGNKTTDGIQEARSSPGIKQKRQDAPLAVQRSNYWHQSHFSLPNKVEWRTPDGFSYKAGEDKPYSFHHQTLGGTGQYVYTVAENGIWDGHPELAKAKAEGRLDLSLDQGLFTPEEPSLHDLHHGTQVSAMVIGETMGSCPKCNLVFVKGNTRMVEVISSLCIIYDHISAGRVGKAVINMSFISGDDTTNQVWLKRLNQILMRLESKTQTVLVAASGNVDKKVISSSDQIIHTYPSRFAASSDRNSFDRIKSMMVVGATNKYGEEADWSQRDYYLTTLAPGDRLDKIDGPTSVNGKTRGTSFAAPAVAGVAAYLRSLRSDWQTQLQEPLNVKKMIRRLHRRIRVYERPLSATSRPVVWNGEVGRMIREPAYSCVSGGETVLIFDDRTAKRCPPYSKELKDLPEEVGESTGSCGDGSNNPSKRAVDGANTCPISPPGGSDGSGGGADGRGIDWSDGPDSPKCPSGTCGGELCRGYYCSPRPKGVPPPDFKDPKDPNKMGANPIGNSPPPPKDDDDDDGKDDDKDDDNDDGKDDDDKGDDEEPEYKNNIIIALSERYIAGGLGTWTRSWVVFPADSDGAWYVCDKAYYSEPAYTTLDIREPPTKIGPFTVEGYECEYEADKGRLGIIRCEGIKQASCGWHKYDATKCGDFGSMTGSLIHCSF